MSDTPKGGGSPSAQNAGGDRTEFEDQEANPTPLFDQSEESGSGRGRGRPPGPRGARVQAREASDQPIVVHISGEALAQAMQGNPVAKTFNPVGFTPNLDKTVEGGRYRVDGQWVNAKGEPIEPPKQEEA